MTTVNVLLGRLERWPAIDALVSKNLARMTDRAGLDAYGAQHIDTMTNDQIDASRKILDFDIRLLELPDENEQLIISEFAAMSGHEQYEDTL